MRLSSGLQQIGELTNAQDKIASLEQQIEDLRSQLAAANTHDVASHVESLFDIASERIQKIPVSQIKPFTGQPRKTFTKATIEKLAISLAQDGQQDPLKLIRDPQEADYLVWDGEIRLRAAQKLEWNSLDARILEMPEDLHWEILKGFFVRHDLNGLDRAEAVIEAITRKTGIPGEKAQNFVRSGYRKLERNKDVASLNQCATVSERYDIYGQAGLGTEQADCIEQIMVLGVPLGTFVVSDISLLSLPLELKDGIRTKGIAVGVANALKKLWSNPPEVNNIDSKRIEILSRGEALTISEAKSLVSGLYPKKASKKFDLKKWENEFNDLKIDELSTEEKSILLIKIKKLALLLEEDLNEANE